MRPVTPSRRNEKKADASSTVHQRPPLMWPTPAGQPLPRQRRQVGQPARLAVGRGRGARSSACRRGRRSGRRPAARRRRPRTAAARCTGRARPAARRRAARACAQRATVASSTPAARPRQPACAAATARPSCANSTGRQSATCTVQARPGSVVHGGIGLGHCSVGGQRVEAHHARAVHLAQPDRPRAQRRAKRRRLAATAAGSSPTATPRFRRERRPG
jgi:hypothetical protein